MLFDMMAYLFIVSWALVGFESSAVGAECVLSCLFSCVCVCARGVGGLNASHRWNSSLTCVKRNHQFPVVIYSVGREEPQGGVDARKTRLTE